MTITNKQRNIMKASLIILAVLYFAPSIIMWVRQVIFAQQLAAQRQAAFYQRQAIQAAQQRAKASAPAPAPSASGSSQAAPGTQPVPTQPTTAKLDPAFAKLAGIWQGRAALPGRGICWLRLELRPKVDQPERMQGFSSLACNGIAQLVSKDRAGGASTLLNRMDPEAAVLSGGIEDGAIHFQVDKVLGADSRGCAATSFTVTPFGTNLIDAAWTEATCQGGHIMLRKIQI